MSLYRKINKDPKNDPYPSLVAYMSMYNDIFTEINPVVEELMNINDTTVAHDKFKNFKKKYSQLEPAGDIAEALEQGPLEKYVYKFRNGEPGKPRNAITLPGLEFMCQHMAGIKSDAAKEDFLKHVRSWREYELKRPAVQVVQPSTQLVRQETSLGKRPATVFQPFTYELKPIEDYYARVNDMDLKVIIPATVNDQINDLRSDVDLLEKQRLENKSEVERVSEKMLKMNARVNTAESNVEGLKLASRALQNQHEKIMDAVNGHETVLSDHCGRILDLEKDEKESGKRLKFLQTSLKHHGKVLRKTMEGFETTVEVTEEMVTGMNLLINTIKAKDQVIQAMGEAMKAKDEVIKMMAAEKMRKGDEAA